MEKVMVRLNLSPDGSGWAIGGDHDYIEAYVYRSPDESRLRPDYYVIIVPVEDESIWHPNNIGEKDGIRGLKVPKVREEHMK